MSYQMVHLEIAYRLLEHYEWLHNCGDFLLGAIAPDAVHFHKEYCVDLKEKSHLWNCGPKWGITIESDKWKRNVLEFWQLHQKDENRDFLAGYCIHILTDWLNDLRIWTPFRESNINGDNVEEIYHIYGQEAYGSDQWLYRNSLNSREIMKVLAGGQPCSIKGCVESADVEKQKSNILNKQYAGKENYDIDDYRYCTKEAILQFIDESVNLFREMLYV